MRTIVIVAAFAGLVGCATVQRDAAMQEPGPQALASLQKQRDDLHRTMQAERRKREYDEWMRW